MEVYSSEYLPMLPVFNGNCIVDSIRAYLTGCNNCESANY
jgi:hypothetical protein